MRIIAGKFKGKKIYLPINKNTRPLRDSLKESIFNILEHNKTINLKLKNSFILDIFSGTGSFGLECFSRGAKEVLFVENYRSALDILEKNINSLDCSKNSKIFRNDFFELEQNFFLKSYKFDIIFLDPPFKYTKIYEIIDLISKMKILKKSGIILLHRHRDAKDLFPLNCKIINSKEFGISKIVFAKYSF